MTTLRALEARVRGAPPWAPDALFALVLAAVEISTPWIMAAGNTLTGPRHYTGSIAAALVVWLASTLPLALRRRYPVAVAFAVLAAAGVAPLLQIPLQGFGLLAAAYSLGAYTGRRRSRMAIIVMVLCIVGLMLAIDLTRLIPSNVLIVVAMWFLGENTKTRRSYTRHLEERARDLARERDNRARLAVAQTRSSIARDLHDVLAHSVSVMVVQASAARRTLRADPQRAEDALLEVERTGRQSMVELRRLLGLLREDSDDLELRPQPRLGQVEDLIRGFREAGLDVELVTEGEPRALGSGVDLSAYRIIQEALTNALKHGDGSTVRVLLTYGARALRVAVDNDVAVPAAAVPAPTPAVSGAGAGLIGMHERAALVGGRLEAGHRPDGGFHVEAFLPVEPS